MSKKIATEEEFRSLMEEVDLELRDQKVPITVRQTKAIWFVKRRLGIVGDTCLSDLPAQPRHGSYEGDDLTVRILHWMRDRYGDRLNIPLAGQTMIVIRGDPYRVELPFAMGNFNLVCDPRRLNVHTTTIGHSGPPTVNGLNLAENLSANLAQSLTYAELQEILSDIASGFRYVMILVRMENHGAMLQQGISDLASSVDDVLRIPPDYGGSRWHSLQAIEKFLKALLAFKGIAYPKGSQGHDIRKLSDLASAFVQAEKSLLDAVMCTAGVRYNEVPSTLQDAHNAHRAAILICHKIAIQLR